MCAAFLTNLATFCSAYLGTLWDVEDRWLWGQGRWGQATLRTCDFEDRWLWGQATLRTKYFEDMRLWGQSTLRTGDFEDRRLWGQATLRTGDFEDKISTLLKNWKFCKIVRNCQKLVKKCQKIYIPQPWARRAHRIPPTDIYSPNVGSIYPRKYVHSSNRNPKNYIFSPNVGSIYPIKTFIRQVLASYIQYFWQFFIFFLKIMSILILLTFSK